MKRKLIVFAGMGFALGIAHAQTNVTIYGTVDTGFIKESGSDVRMDENNANVIGFRGTEELGSGLRATFQLERQFQLPDGTNKDTYSLDDSMSRALGNRRQTIDWTGAANVGLEGNWGAFRLGRVNEMSVEYYTDIDPFLQGTTGSSLAKYSLLRSEQLSNTIRYDSPLFSGVRFGLTYTLGADDHDRTISRDIFNDGFGVSLRYENGPLFLTGNFSRQADSDRSYVWNLGGAWDFDPVRLSLGYQKSNLKDLSVLNLDDIDSPVTQKTWLLGLQYKVGAGTVNASYNRATVDGTVHGNANKYALGYTYDLSKRTSLYAVVSYLDSDNGYVASLNNDMGTENTSITGVQFGMTHNF